MIGIIESEWCVLAADEQHQVFFPDEQGMTWQPSYKEVFQLRLCREDGDVHLFDGQHKYCLPVDCDQLPPEYAVTNSWCEKLPKTRQYAVLSPFGYRLLASSDTVLHDPPPEYSGAHGWFRNKVNNRYHERLHRALDGREMPRVVIEEFATEHYSFIDHFHQSCARRYTLGASSLRDMGSICAVADTYALRDKERAVTFMQRHLNRAVGVRRSALLEWFARFHAVHEQPDEAISYFEAAQEAYFSSRREREISRLYVESA
ncbi:hypothetical protein GF342_02580 [Candidatus Woesearchaeota archaeon]|nr:hypothetical protein [Candidatus Woesearchaeota archaeon]